MSPELTIFCIGVGMVLMMGIGLGVFVRRLLRQSDAIIHDSEHILTDAQKYPLSGGRR